MAEKTISKVSRPAEVSFEEFAMLAFAQHGALAGKASLLYWWMVHLCENGKVVWPGANVLADLIGVHRQNIYPLLKDLEGSGFITRSGEEETPSIQVVVPETVSQEAVIAIAIASKRMRATVVEKTNSKKRRKRAAQTDPLPDGNEDLSTRTDGTKVKGNSEPKAKLSPENVAKICASFESVTNYLLYGMPGVLEPDEVKRKSLPPSKLNWRQFISPDMKELNEESLGLKNWDVKHFIGFYWFRVAYWRNSMGIQQTLPNYGRLGRCMDLLRKQMTSWQIYSYISVVTMHFDLLCCMIGSIADNFILDEMALTHGLIRNAAIQYLSVAVDSQNSYYEQHQDQLAARKHRYGR